MRELKSIEEIECAVKYMEGVLMTHRCLKCNCSKKRKDEYDAIDEKIYTILEMMTKKV